MRQCRKCVGARAEIQHQSSWMSVHSLSFHRTNIPSHVTFQKKTQVNDSSIVLSHGLHCKHYFSFSSPHQATHDITPPPDSDTKTIQIFSFFESYIMKTLEKHTVTFLFYVSFKCENRWIVQVRIAVFFFFCCCLYE